METDYNFSFKEERAQYSIEKLLLLLIFEPLFSITAIEREDFHHPCTLYILRGILTDVLGIEISRATS